jgi:hypothetical protein
MRVEDAARGAGPVVRVGAGLIRPYRAEDREIVREICRKTAYRNRGSASVIEDGELFADYWTKYYTDCEPESAFVLEEDGQVIGYLLGCADTAKLQRVMARRIVPSVLARAIFRLLTFRYHDPNSRRMLYWLLRYGWQEDPHVPLDRYPAHYHCNILRKGYGKGYYSALGLYFLDRIQERGIDRLHGQVQEPAQGGPWDRTLETYSQNFDTSPIEYSAEKPSTFQRYMFGIEKPMVNKAWASNIEAYRGWLVWTAEKYHM